MSKCRVIEHEKGYRAQFGAIKSLDWGHALERVGTTLEHLRHIYRLAA